MIQEVNILLVEDDENDILAIRRAFKKHSISNPLFVVENGEDALDFLHNRGEYEDEKAHPKPDLILLDINMPRMNGIEFLNIIKRDDKFKSIPVVILTSSKREWDKIESYKLGVNSYIIKPVDFDKFADSILMINQYWSMTELP
ncbi:response regulator [Candidatus Sumerlaeota bacterium]|nr:response regulator [Candidatus Sumerlaeota bacterium]